MKFKIGDIIREYMGPNTGSWIGVIKPSSDQGGTLLEVKWIGLQYGLINAFTDNIAYHSTIYCRAEELL